MAAGTGTVWAIDIGNFSLKALHLGPTVDGVEILGFENIYLIALSLVVFLNLCNDPVSDVVPFGINSMSVP